MVSLFVLIYYTDVAGIAAGAARMLFLVARIWGGGTDLVADRRVDETSTRWARLRPTCCSPRSLVALLVAMFSIPSGLGSGGKLAWAYASCALFQPPTASSTFPTARCQR